MTCGTTSVVKVVTQRIPTLLSDLANLNEDSSFRVLEDSFHGFEEIGKRFKQGFTVSGNMIGLNKANEVRVWLNKDFSKNNPEVLKSDHQMIESLLKAVEAANENGSFPQYFKDQIARQKQPYTFKGMRLFMEEFNRKQAVLKEEYHLKDLTSQPMTIRP